MRLEWGLNGAWLRQMAWEQLVHYHRRHVNAQIRSVSREERKPFELSEHSELQLADRLVASETSVSVCFLREETLRRLRIALSRLRAIDRETLTLRFLEQLSQDEAAAVLGITKGAFNMRQLRALKRLKTTLDEQED